MLAHLLLQCTQREALPCSILLHIVLRNGIRHRAFNPSGEKQPYTTTTNCKTNDDPTPFARHSRKPSKAPSTPLSSKWLAKQRQPTHLFENPTAKSTSPASFYNLTIIHPLPITNKGPPNPFSQPVTPPPSRICYPRTPSSPYLSP